MCLHDLLLNGMDFLRRNGVNPEGARARAIRRGPVVQDKIVLNFHGVQVKESDRRTLTGEYWLTDTIISFYSEYLAHRIYPQHHNWLFVSAEMSQLIRCGEPAVAYGMLASLNAGQMAFIFFPMNSGSHWTLLVFSRPERAFYHFDSAHHTNARNICLPMVERLKEPLALNIPRPSIRLEDSLQQGDMDNCGIHVLCNLDMATARILNSGGVAVADTERPPDDVVHGKRQEVLNTVERLAREQAAAGNPGPGHHPAAE